MCGRYASSRRPGDLVEIFEIEENDLEPEPPADPAPAGPEAAGEGAAASPPEGAGEKVAEAPEKRPWTGKYNVAPTATVPVVLERMKPDGEAVEDSLDPDGEGTQVPLRAVRQLRGLTWGLVPSWSKDRTGGARMINARVESLLDRPAFKRAALSRRCLVPADGWYEWQASPTQKNDKGKPRKQPFFLQLADGEELAFAGIYEFWRDKELPADDPSAWLITFAVITTAAEPGLDVIHDRMPLVLPPERWKDWLDPELHDPDAVRALLVPPPPGRFSAVPITNRVNSVRNEGPELLEPAPVDSLVGVVDPATGEVIGGTAESSSEARDFQE